LCSVVDFRVSSIAIVVRCECNIIMLCACVASEILFSIRDYTEYTGWPKKVSHYQMIKNRIKSYQNM